MQAERTDPEDDDLDRAIRLMRENLGPQILELLDDPATIDVALMADGRLWVVRLGEPRRYVGTVRLRDAFAIIRTAVGLADREITTDEPTYDGCLPFGGLRFSAVIPPVSRRGPQFTIRKPASRVIPLAEYVEVGIVSGAQAEILSSAVTQNANIVVAGSTGSGKTTLLNALIARAVADNPSQHFVIIEDTGELQCAGEVVSQWEQSDGADMTMLVRRALRHSPERILIGEVRGAEALDLLDAWNTGHPGFATIHANSASDALTRLESLATRNPAHPPRVADVIVRAVQIVAFISKTSAPPFRKLRAIERVCGHDGRYFVTETLAQEST